MVPGFVVLQHMVHGSVLRIDAWLLDSAHNRSGAVDTGKIRTVDTWMTWYPGHADTK